MIGIFNKSLGCLVLILSNCILHFSRSLKKKFEVICSEVIQCNEKNFDKPIPKNLSVLIILVEDRRFYRHLGVDFYSVMRAVYRILFLKKIEGASTISQQLIRIIIDERELTIQRKLQEIALSILLNQLFKKDEIFCAYFSLYEIENSTGIYNFCKNSNLDINNLSIVESCEIVARLKYPFISKNSQRYIQRVKMIERKYYLEKNGESLNKVSLSNNLML